MADWPRRTAIGDGDVLHTPLPNPSFAWPSAYAPLKTQLESLRDEPGLGLVRAAVFNAEAASTSDRADDARCHHGIERSAGRILSSLAAPASLAVGGGDSQRPSAASVTVRSESRDGRPPAAIKRLAWRMIGGIASAMGLRPARRLHRLHPSIERSAGAAPAGRRVAWACRAVGATSVYVRLKYGTG